MDFLVLLSSSYLIYVLTDLDKKVERIRRDLDWTMARLGRRADDELDTSK